MFAASKSGRAAAATDPYFKYVPLLLETTTTNGQQNNTFLDSSTNNFTITRNGAPTQGSVTPYWPNGYWSNYFNGTTDYLQIAANTALNITGGAFTIECWVYLPATSANPYFFIVQDDGSSNGTVFQFRANTTRTLEFTYWTTSSRASAVAKTTTSTIPLNAWTHVAVTWDTTTLNLYINGVNGFSGAVASMYSVNFATAIGDWVNNLNPNGFLNAYISNLRVVKGTAVYTSAFTPSTTPLTAITNTALLTCQSNRFKDNSTNNFAITVNGTPKVQAFQPFSPTASYTTAAYGGSGYFNGSTDYLSSAYNSAFDVATGSFTAEAWINISGQFAVNSDVLRVGAILCFGPSVLNTGGYEFIIDQTSNTLSFAVPGGTKMVCSYTFSFNTWYHVAASRNVSTNYLFVNGTSQTLTTNTYAGLSGTSGNLTVGLQGRFPGYNDNFYGYISNLRLVKGVAVYTGNFTPPTLAPLTTAGSTSAASYSSTTNVNTSFAASSTSLLTNFTNAGIYDAAVQNNQITVGDAQASTTVSKWSPTSMKFDGTGDWLTAIDGPQLQLGTGDFTIEGWVYLSATGVAYGIISKGTATTGWSVNVTSGNKLQFSYTASNLTGATSLASATWYYFAVVRSGSATGNLKVYLNGTADATSGGAVTDSFTQTNTLYVGADRVGGSALNGYLQDVRLTKGFARTITTPTAAFPTR